MNNFLEIAQEIGQLVEEKNAAYGSSFAKAGEFLQLLYPEGITPAQMPDALLLVRIFDKQMRIATDRDALGESPFSDIAGYGILGVHMHHQIKETKASCSGTAKAAAASQSHASQPASAPQPAATPTTKSASETSVPEPSQQPANFFDRLDLASARTATAPASASVEGPLSESSALNKFGSSFLYDTLLWRSNVGLCAWCEQKTSEWLWAEIQTPRGSICLRACSFDCEQSMEFASVRGLIYFVGGDR